MKKILDVLFRKPINFICNKTEQFIEWLFISKDDTQNNSNVNVCVSKNDTAVKVDTQSGNSNVTIIDNTKYTCFELETFDIINDNIEIITKDSTLYLVTSQFMVATDNDVEFINKHILAGTKFKFQYIKNIGMTLIYELEDSDPIDDRIIQGIYYCGCIDTFLHYAKIPK